LSCEDALTLAEHIRSAVSQHLFTVGGGIHLTCSIGVASFPEHTSVLETLVSAADQAMYRAKNLGRNVVCRFCDPASQDYDEVEGGREEAATSGTVAALMKLIAVHEPATFLHCQQVSELLSQLAHAMNLSASEIHMLVVAGQLHDLGKIAIPDSLLQKTGPLTAEEWSIIRLHPATGAEIIESIPALRTVAPLIRSHHEYWNGLGYPDHLVAEAIPLGARMLAVVNAYIVMTTDRPYQRAHDPATTLQDIQRDAGSRFDPSIVAALSDLLGVCPPLEQQVATGFSGRRV
jgi:HD-GYP domain-containing protein (c-di-GMP phosphodiesterase class II)